MASKDFIFDLLDKLEEEKLEYVLMTLSNEKEESTGDIFYNFYFKDSPEVAARVLKEASEHIKNSPDGPDSHIEIDMNDEDDD